MEKTPGCQLCESGVPTFRDEHPEVMPSYPKIHLIGHGVTSYVIPCNAEERTKMEEVQKILMEAEAQKP